MIYELSNIKEIIAQIINSDFLPLKFGKIDNVIIVFDFNLPMLI